MNVKKLSILSGIAVALTVTMLSQAQSPSEQAKPSDEQQKAVRESIEAFSKLLMASRAPAATRAGGPGGTITTPQACGKKFTSAEMLTSGANISVQAHAFVNDPAETGIYRYYLYLKVADDAGNVIREATSTGEASKGVDDDFGYIESIKKCYCDATKLHLTLALASISPSGKFVLHQYKECDFEIEPAP